MNGGNGRRQSAFCGTCATAEAHDAQRQDQRTRQHDVSPRSYRHRNSFSAKRKAHEQPSREHADLRRDLRQRCALQHRRAQRIVQGRERQRFDDRLNGVRKSLRREEHAGQDPHRQHRQVHEARRRLDRSGARREQQAERAECERAEHTYGRNEHERPAYRHAEHQHGEAEKRADFDDEHREPRDQKRKQEVVTRHRSGDEPLHQLAPPRVDDREAHAPDRAAHQVHAEQPRNQEIDVAGSRLAHELIFGGHGIRAPGALLHRHVGSHARVAPFGIRVVVVVDDGAVRGTLDEQCDFPLAQRAQAVVDGRERLDRERGRVLERRKVRSDDADGQHFGRRVAEREPEAGREQQRKPEHPKQRFRLAQELAKPDERQLHERMVTHRADGAPSA